MTQPSPTRSLLVHARGADTALPGVEVFMRNFSQRLRSRMVSRCSKDFQVRLTGITGRRICDTLKDEVWKDSGVFGLLRLDSVGLAGLVAIQVSVLTRIILAMTGDDEAADAPRGGPRSMSPVELRIATRTMQDICRDLTATWPLRPAVEVDLEGSPGGPRVIDPRSATEEVFWATMELGPVESPFGLLCVGVPTQALRGLGAAGGPARREARKPGDFSRVMPVEVEVVAEMARLPMRVRDLRALSIGDLVPLGALDGALLRVNGREVLVGEPGHANGQRSVRVIRKLAR